MDSFKALTRSQAILCYLCDYLGSSQLKKSQERICGEPGPLVPTPKVTFKFPLVFVCFLLEVYQRLASFKVLTRSQFSFMFFLSAWSKAGQFQSTYQILDCTLFHICLFPLLIVSFHSINQTLKRSLDIDDLPHGPLLPLSVLIKSSYDSIAQWTENLPSSFFLIKTYSFACNFSLLNLFTFGTFHL